MEGQLDRSKAYNYALPVIGQVLEENPTIQVVIDLQQGWSTGRKASGDGNQRKTDSANHVF